MLASPILIGGKKYGFQKRKNLVKNVETCILTPCLYLIAMTTTLLNPLLRFKPSLLRTGVLFASIAGLLAPSLVRADVTVSVDKGQSSTARKAAPAAAPSGGSGGGYGGKGKSSSKTESASGSTFYTITVTNMAANPASGVTLEYHIFNKTTVTGGPGPSTTSLDDITNSTTFDLAPNAKNVIETNDIPYSTTTVTSGGGGGGGGKKSGGAAAPATQTSTVTSVLGWVVYVKKGDKIIHTYPSSDSIMDKVAQLKAGK